MLCFNRMFIHFSTEKTTYYSMKNFLPSILALFTLLALQPPAKAGDGWRPAYRLPHFTAEYPTCSNQMLELIKQQLQEQNIPAASWQKVSDSFYSSLRPRDVLRPFVNEKNVLVGLNMRWISVTPDCRNPLLYCDANRPDTCTEISSGPHEEVLQPLFFNEEILIAERETFKANSLNTSRSDFVVSKDTGKSWNHLTMPVRCGQQGGVCRLIPQTALKYILISTIYDESKSDFEDVTVNTTVDGGVTWMPSIDKWKGVRIPEMISVEGDLLVSVPKGQGEFVSLSSHKLLSHKTEEINTGIPSDAWDTSFGTVVINFSGGHLIQLVPKKRVVNGVGGIFFVRSGKVPSTTLIWPPEGMPIGDLQVSKSAIVIRTWNPKLLLGHSFEEKIHYSLDGGTTWKMRNIPQDLLSGTMLLLERKLWLFSTSSIQYLNLTDTDNGN